MIDDENNDGLTIARYLAFLGERERERGGITEDILFGKPGKVVIYTSDIHIATTVSRVKYK